jgi:hypothetical protein
MARVGRNYLRSIAKINMYLLHPLVISHQKQVSKIMNLIMTNDMSCIANEEFKQQETFFFENIVERSFAHVIKDNFVIKSKYFAIVIQGRFTIIIQVVLQL